MRNFTPDELQRVRDVHESWLRSLPGVLGTGIGIDTRGRMSVKVFSNHISAETRNAIAERLQTFPVAFEETGEIRKQTAQS
jgi:hypothetical protein